MWDIVLSLAITVLGLLGLVLNIVGLPGTWFMAVIAGIMTFYLADSRLPAMELTSFVIILVIAAIGEILEFIAGAAGVSKQGGSKRSAALAIAGSIIGAIVGLFVGTPVPVIGSVVVSLLLGGAGAFAGAALGERWVGRDWDSAMEVGRAAFWGRLLGTFGKVVCSGTIMCILIGAAWVPS